MTIQLSENELREIIANAFGVDLSKVTIRSDPGSATIKTYVEREIEYEHKSIN